MFKEKFDKVQISCDVSFQVYIHQTLRRRQQLKNERNLKVEKERELHTTPFIQKTLLFSLAFLFFFHQDDESILRKGEIDEKKHS